VTNIRFGFCEVLGLFAAAALWHNFVLALVCIILAATGAFFRIALDIQREAKTSAAREEATKMLHEQVGEFGQTIGSLLGGAAKKKKSSSGGGFH
jgi:hypothetical protein